MNNQQRILIIEADNVTALESKSNAAIRSLGPCWSALSTTMHSCNDSKSTRLFITILAICNKTLDGNASALILNYGSLNDQIIKKFKKFKILRMTDVWSIKMNPHKAGFTKTELLAIERALNQQGVALSEY